MLHGDAEIALLDEGAEPGDSPDSAPFVLKTATISSSTAGRDSSLRPSCAIAPLTALNPISMSGQMCPWKAATLSRCSWVSMIDSPSLLISGSLSGGRNTIQQFVLRLKGNWMRGGAICLVAAALLARLCSLGVRSFARELNAPVLCAAECSSSSLARRLLRSSKISRSTTVEAKGCRSR